MVEFLKKPEEYGLDDYIEQYVPEEIKDASEGLGITELEQRALSMAMEIEVKHVLYVINKAESDLGFSKENMETTTEKHADGNGATVAVSYTGKDEPVFLGSVSHRFKMTPRGDGKEDALTLEISRTSFDDDAKSQKQEKPDDTK